VLTLASTSLFGGCVVDSDGAPRTLMDGSLVRQVPVELEDVEAPMALTIVNVRNVPGPRGARVEACLRGRGFGLQPEGPAVERIGVHAESVTFLEEGGRSVFGCDDSTGPELEGRRFCGGASGRLDNGRLIDPRLNILCTTADGDLMGFVWVQPAIEAKYVTVAQPGYAEVYEVAGGLPIRISTVTDVELERTRARFNVFEHDAAGNLLQDYEIEAAVAG
jgi:hypothetical protein